MKLTLELARTELFVQETTSVRIVLENNTSREVSVPALRPASAAFKIRVTQVTTDKTTDHGALDQKRSHDSHYLPSRSPARSTVLEPGARQAYPLSLLTWVGTLDSGEYEVRAIFIQGEETIESAPVVLKIEATPTLRSIWAPPSTPMLPKWHSVDAKGSPGQPLELLLQTWEFAPCASVSRSIRLGKIDRYTSAAVSVMPAKMWDQGHWVAWIQKSRLAYTSVDENGQVGKTRTHSLPNGESQLLGPLFHATALSQPPGDWSAVVVQSGGASPGRSALLCLEFLAKGKESGEHAVPLSPGTFQWGKTTYSSEGHRAAAAVTTRANKVMLETLEWPKGAAPNSELGQLSWTGTHIASHLTLGDDDVMRGALLLLAREKESDNPRVEVISWEKPIGGELAETKTVGIDWPPDRGLSEARLAVSRKGDVGALLLDNEGVWHLYRGDPALSRSPLQAPDSLAIDFLFVRTKNPLIRMGDGFGRSTFFRLDGTPFPTW